MKSSWRWTLGLVIFVCGMPATSPAATSEVFRLSMTLHGFIQRGVVPNTVIGKVMITSDDFINLAQSRVLGTPVPKNEVLAFANDCTNANLRLIVFDTTTFSNLVTIGSLSNLAFAVHHRKREARSTTQLTIANISTVETNGTVSGIFGGSFIYNGDLNIDTNNCPTQFGGRLTGFLGTAFSSTCSSNICTNFVVSCTLSNCIEDCTSVCVTNCDTNCVTRLDCHTVSFPCTEAFNVIIPGTPLTTGKSIGELIEP